MANSSPAELQAKRSRLEQLKLKQQKLEEEINQKKQKAKQIDVQIRDYENRQSKKQRSEETRKKILVGAAYLNLVECGKLTQPELMEVLDVYLKSERDRKVFGLPISTKTEAKSELKIKEKSATVATQQSDPNT